MRGPVAKGNSLLNKLAGEQSQKNDINKFLQEQTDLRVSKLVYDDLIKHGALHVWRKISLIGKDK